jgi:beta-phosphoglucomutase-like phosphatase (HAD superfamily)
VQRTPPVALEAPAVIAEATAPGRYREGMIQALLFDFDGTLWDSETVVFEAYRRMYDDHGHTLDLEEWSAAVGTLDGFDPMADLELRLGRALDRSVVDPWERVDDLMVGVGLRSGVREWLDDARDRGLSLGIVSSNDRRWIRHHLDRLEIGDRWGAIVAADGDAGRAKPNPVLYREALAELGVDAPGAIAIEDSPHGIAAAKEAGLFCVAVPNEVTQTLDLTAADLVIATFRDMSLTELLGFAAAGGRDRSGD